MKRSRLVGLAGLGVAGAAFVWLAARPRPREAPAISAEPIAEADAAVAESDEPREAPPEAPWVPSGRACHHWTAPRATFADLSGSFLAALIVDGYDPRTRRFPLSLNDAGMHEARDCRGDSVEFDHALTDAELVKPSAVMMGAAPDADAGAGARVRVDRFDVRGPRMAVFATVAVSAGYYFQCVGFQAVVRLDADEAVVEGVSAASLYGCDERGSELHLANVGDRVALLLPVNVSTGESGDYETAWSVSLPEHGALRHIGDIRSGRGAGNGSITSGRWFGNMTAQLLDAGSLRVEETWDFVRYAPDGSNTNGATRKVIRSYEPGDGGLVRSPATDPTK